jgi:nucleoside-diphosphate-sugar epimerase
VYLNEKVNRQMKTVAIIGASGHVGFRLVQKLSSRYNIHCIVRDTDKRDFSELNNIEVFKVDDISNTLELAKAINNCHVIINAGYIWFAKEILQAVNINKSSIEHILFTGSTGIFTKIPSSSAELKREAEQYIVDNYSIPFTIIRPTMIYGHKNDHNISKLSRTLRKTPFFPLVGSGDKLIQPVYIDDLVKAYEIALLGEKFYNNSYNIAGAEPISNKELFKKVSNSLDKKVIFISIHPYVISIIIKLLALFKLKIISDEQIKRFQENKNIDIEKFVQAFGFRPRSFDDGLKQMKKIHVL